MHKKVICILFASILAAHATTFYVATDGLNSNPGTITHPWETISYATGTSSPVGAGDTIMVRSGNYPEQVFPAKSGTLSLPIVLTNYPGETVTLNPGNMQINNGVDYWKIDGLAFSHSSSNGFRVTGIHPLRFLTVSNCVFSFHSYNGIELGGGTGNTFGGITIEDCVIDSNGTVSEGTGILMYGGVGVLWAHRNLLRGNNGKGISHATEAAWQADSSVIDSNIIINTFASGMDWWGDNSYITHNYFSGNGQRDPEPGEWGDNGLSLDQNASGNLVAYNVVKSSGRFEFETRGSGNQIYNNTFIKDFYYTAVPGSPEAATMIFYGSGGSGNEFRNNIFLNLRPEPYHHYIIVAENVGRYTAQIWSNNLYWAPNASNPPPANKPFKLYGFSGSVYATLEEIQATYPDQEIGSLYDNPDFVSYADSNFNLLPGSPAIDAGIDVGFPYYGDAPDMGAFEYDPAGIPSFEETPNNTLNLQVSPNPFIQAIEIKFQLPGVTSSEKQVASMKIYNISGRLVKNFPLSTSYYLLATPLCWDGTDNSGQQLPSGIYFCSLESTDSRATEKIIKLK